MVRILIGALMASSAAVIASPAVAQVSVETSGQAEAKSLDSLQTIIVTARRRDENVQDVPVVINTVSADDIAKLNLREFNEVETLVPGLQLRNEANGIGASAQIRGVAFDITASTQPSVDFYLNDAPIDAPIILQGMYDIAQIEVTRGPQGTLRGRSSPSGAIVITTRKPSLYEFGGNLSATANDIGTMNFNGGIGGPIIEGVLGVRVAGLFSEGEGNRVRTIDRDLDGRDPYSKTKSYRASAVFEPADFVRFEGVYQRADLTSRSYDQYASFSLVAPDATKSPILITPKDRLSIQEDPREIEQDYEVFNWRAEGRLAGQVLIYQGQRADSKVYSRQNADVANVFDGFDTYQFTDSRSKLTSHEIRLQNEERLFDTIDYIAGYFYQKRNSPTALIRQDAVFLPPFLGGGLVAVANTNILSPSEFKENSFFGNVTAHLGDKLELSAGARHIHFESPAGVIQVGSFQLPGAAEVDEKHVIYNLSAKYSLSPDVMVYASTGTSRRPGPTIVGVFSPVQSELMRSFISLDSESSTSYELGLKTTLFDNALRFNVTGFYQEFENYAFKLTSPVYFQNFTFIPGSGIVPGVGLDSQFAANVPLEVKGIEMELAATPFDNFDVSLTAAYADGKIKNGLIPCDDLNGDGVPDNLTAAPTVADLQAAYGANFIGACEVTQRSSNQAPFSATLQAAYSFPVSDRVDGFTRGLFNFLGNSKNVPTNAFDDVDSYGLLNLYAGIRDPEGMWEVNFFAKNVLDKVKATRFNAPAVTSYQVLQPPTFTTTAGESATSTYSVIGTTAPREFGLTVSFAFGSR